MNLKHTFARIFEIDKDEGKLELCFVGLCDQMLVHLGSDEHPSLRNLKSKFSLPLPERFPVKEFHIEFRKSLSENEEVDIEGSVLSQLEKDGFGFAPSDGLIVRFDLTEDLMKYVHREIPLGLRMSETDSDEHNERVQWAYRSALRSITTFIAKHFVICANICKAGSINLKDGVVLVADKRIGVTYSYQSPLPKIASVESEKNVRLLRELDLVKTWPFYSGLSGTFLGDPKSPIEIAVSNLSDLFDERFDHSGGRNLIWGFAGLEALLADSDTSIGSQLKQKLVALFGNQVDAAQFAQEIADIYKYRSKIIHGNRKDGAMLSNLSRNFFAANRESAETKVAIWLLIGVIQYCFQNKQTELKFKTVVI